MKRYVVVIFFIFLRLFDFSRLRAKAFNSFFRVQNNQIKFLSEKLKLVSSRLHDARRRGYMPYNNDTFIGDDIDEGIEKMVGPPGFNALPCPSFMENENEDAYNRCDIYVGDLPSRINDAELYNLFEKYGSIAAVHNAWGAFAFVVCCVFEHEQMLFVLQLFFHLMNSFISHKRHS